MYRPYITEYHQYIAPDGSVYKFDGEDARFVISDTGLGLPDINYIADHGPYQHGETILDFRLQPRIIQMIIRHQASGRGDYWNSRHDLLSAIKPNRQLLNTFNMGTLRKYLPYGKIRDAHVMIAKGPAYQPRDTSQWDEYGWLETLQFRAPDPLLYDPNAHTLTWYLVANNQLVFPITFPIVFGGNYMVGTQSITYVGDWMTWPAIQIYGPLNGPRIIHNELGITLHLAYNISAGEVATFTMNYDNKTITNNYGSNLIGLLENPSSLALFRIAPDPEVSGGIQTITVNGSGASTATHVVLSYQDTYIGL